MPKKGKGKFDGLQDGGKLRIIPLGGINEIVKKIRVN